MKMWKSLTVITLSLSIALLSGYAFARQGGHYSGRSMYHERVDNNRYGKGYYHKHRPHQREYRSKYVARDWRRGGNGYRYYHTPRHYYRAPFMSFRFASPLQFTYPSTNYLYIYGVDFR